jgi:4-hydroxybenzoate polyprenyltransferase
LENTTTNKQGQQAVIENASVPTAPQEETTDVPRMGTFARISALIREMRPRQWTKNGAVFIGLIFSQNLLNLVDCERALLAFITFCFASSSVYILNDLLDLEKDRQHPTKRLRPLASGQLPVSWAIGGMGVLLLLCAALIITLFELPSASHLYGNMGGANILFTVTIVAYLLMNVLYTVRLKHVVLIDVFIIALGFVLRALAGTLVIPAIISPWLYLVTSFLSLFLALSKRRHELVLLQGQASNHRKILKEYSIPMLDQMITIVVAGTLMSYSLYTIEGPTGNQRLLVTVPFVLYGVFRYLYLVYMRMEGGSPDEVLLRDRPILVTVLLCTVLVVAVLYLRIL